MFNETDYRILSEVLFEVDEQGNALFPGYRPEVKEAPNGDGYWDNDKRYAHVALKYFEQWEQQGNVDIMKAQVLQHYLVRANDKATEVAIKLGVPKEFWPDIRYGALRVLEYPPGAVTNPHKDFDLFTLMCYRNIESDFKYIIEGTEDDPKTYRSDGTHDHRLVEAQKLNSQIHFGEILELVMPVYKANMHEVVADPHGRAQYSIVYFSIPDHSVVLPDGQTVKQWLDERLSRSRKTVEVK